MYPREVGKRFLKRKKGGYRLAIRRNPCFIGEIAKEKETEANAGISRITGIYLVMEHKLTVRGLCINVKWKSGK